MMGKLSKLMLLILACLFLLYLKTRVSYSDNEGKVVKISQEYTGIIIDKYNVHGTHLKIQTKAHGIIDITMLSANLIDKSSIGDSILKIKNQNTCILIKDGKKQVMQYIYVLEKE